MRNKFINKSVSGKGTCLKEDKQVLDRKWTEWGRGVRRGLSKKVMSQQMWR